MLNYRVVSFTLTIFGFCINPIIPVKTLCDTNNINNLFAQLDNSDQKNHEASYSLLFSLAPKCKLVRSKALALLAAKDERRLRAALIILGGTFPEGAAKTRDRLLKLLPTQSALNQLHISNTLLDLNIRDAPMAFDYLFKGYLSKKMPVKKLAIEILTRRLKSLFTPELVAILKSDNKELQLVALKAIAENFHSLNSLTLEEPVIWHMKYGDHNVSHSACKALNTIENQHSKPTSVILILRDTKTEAVRANGESCLRYILRANSSHQKTINRLELEKQLKSNDSYRKFYDKIILMIKQDIEN